MFLTLLGGGVVSKNLLTVHFSVENRFIISLVFPDVLKVGKFCVPSLGGWISPLFMSYVDGLFG